MTTERAAAAAGTAPAAQDHGADGGRPSVPALATEIIDVFRATSALFVAAFVAAGEACGASILEIITNSSQPSALICGQRCSEIAIWEKDETVMDRGSA